jgi:predicted ester cyclase
MTTSEAIVRRYYDAANMQQYATYHELFTADCVLETPGASTRGVTGVLEFDQNWKSAFPDAQAEILRMTTVGNLVFTANWYNAGLHQGTLKTVSGDIPPTGKSLSAPYTAMFRIESGKIAEQRIVFDAAALPLLLGFAGTAAAGA